MDRALELAEKTINWDFLEALMPTSSSYKLPEVSILLVDDDKDFRKTVRSALRDVWPDCKFDSAANLATAVKKVRKNKYTIIFIDINLGDDNGIDLLRKIRKENERNKRTIICVITGGPIGKTIERIVKESGGSWCKSKPYPPGKESIGDMLSDTKTQLQLFMGMR